MANQHESNKEIDLGLLSNQMRRYYVRAGDSFFNFVLFIKRNIIWLAIIFIIGAGLGIYLDSGAKTYSHNVFVIPNFGSVDYLYREVEHINAKLMEGDTAYLASIGIKSPKLKLVKIEPVVDIYKFLDIPEENIADRRLRLFEIIAQQGDVKKVLEEDVTGKNYRTHLITIKTNGPARVEDLITPLLKHFNSNSYFKELQKAYINNNDLKLMANNVMIGQIDSVVSDFNKASRNKQPGLMYYNDNTPLNELLKVKNNIINEQEENRINQLDYTDIVKQAAVIPNNLTSDGLSGKMKFIVPFFFFLGFVGVVRFRRFYKTQMLKRTI